jgi:hypothetical protein
MSQIILNSAENSALIQTLQQSDSKVIPSIYSTKEVYAPSATTWFNQTPTAGQTPAAGSSVTYDLNKYGIAEQMLFTFGLSGSFSIPTGLTGNHRLVAPAGYIYELIDRVDFLSSSRVISTIYAEDLRAQHTNMSMEALAPVVQTAIGPQFGTGVAAGSASSLSAEYCVPIMFGFMKDINTQPNLSFMEACQVRITFKRPNYLFLADDSGKILPPTGLTTGANLGPVTATPTFSAGTGFTGSLPVLQVRYKQYGEADTAQLLAENYNAEQLNMLTSRCFRENPKSFTLAATAAGTDFQQKVSIDLRNVDVVKAYYIFVTRDVTGQASTEVFTGVAGERSVQQCYEISSVKLTASGQEICTINRTQNLYSRLTENGHAFNAVAAGVPLSNVKGTSIDALNLQNVYKIQTGLWENDGGGAWSNGWSMREMTNMQIEVTMPLAVGGGATGAVTLYPNRGRMETQAAGSETKYTLHVVEDCSTILSTASNTGRTVNSLTN